MSSGGGERIEGETQSKQAFDELPWHFDRPEAVFKTQRKFLALSENGSLQLKRRYLNIVLERIEVKVDLVRLTTRTRGNCHNP